MGKKKLRLHEDSKLIDQMGGTAAVARECSGSSAQQISNAAVSKWRRAGIPGARRDYLRMRFPEVFGGRSPEASESLVADAAPMKEAA